MFYKLFEHTFCSTIIIFCSVWGKESKWSIISAPTCAQRRRDWQIFEHPLLHGNFERIFFSSIFKMRPGIFSSVHIGRLETMPQCLSHSWSGAWLTMEKQQQQQKKRDWNHSIVFCSSLSFSWCCSFSCAERHEFISSSTVLPMVLLYAS